MKVAPGSLAVVNDQELLLLKSSSWFAISYLEAWICYMFANYGAYETSTVQKCMSSQMSSNP